MSQREWFLKATQYKSTTHAYLLTAHSDLDLIYHNSIVLNLLMLLITMLQIY